MSRTNFANVNGLPDDRQVTTARDLAKLARAIIIAFPEHADLFTTVQVQVGKQIMRTHNGLLVDLPGAERHEDGVYLQLRIQRGGERHPRRPKAGRRRARRAIESHAPRARDRSLGERLQALFLEVAFGTSIDGLAIQQASLTDGPPHLKDAICGVAKPKPSGTRKVSRKGGSKKREAL